LSLHRDLVTVLVDAEVIARIVAMAIGDKQRRVVERWVVETARRAIQGASDDRAR